MSKSTMSIVAENDMIDAANSCRDICKDIYSTDTLLTSEQFCEVQKTLEELDNYVTALRIMTGNKIRSLKGA